MLLPLVALASAIAEAPPITCDVHRHRIVVRFFRQFPDSITDKFAVVQAGTARGGEWLYVVDDDPPLRFSPYRPGMKRLVIDTRRRLSVSCRNGQARIVPAFPKPGRYTLIFSDNLGTEPENMASWGMRGARAVTRLTAARGLFTARSSPRP